MVTEEQHWHLRELRNVTQEWHVGEGGQLCRVLQLPLVASGEGMTEVLKFIFSFVFFFDFFFFKVTFMLSQNQQNQDLSLIIYVANFMFFWQFYHKACRKVAVTQTGAIWWQNFHWSVTEGKKKAHIWRVAK